MTNRKRSSMSYKGLNSPILGGHGNVIAKGGVAVPFPWRLHEMLEVAAQEGLEDIVSWAPHGRAFRVHHPKHFTKHVLPRYVIGIGQLIFPLQELFLTLTHPPMFP